MRDILKEIRDGAIGEDGAYDALDEILASEDATNAPELLGLTAPEWTAQAQGARLAELARWRYTGWPSTCAECNRPIEVARFGWSVGQHEGKTVLRHIACLPQPSGEPDS